MRPSVPVLTGKSAKRKSFMLICSTDDIDDGTKCVGKCSVSIKITQRKTHTLPDPQRSTQSRQGEQAGP